MKTETLRYLYVYFIFLLSQSLTFIRGGLSYWTTDTGKDQPDFRPK